MASLQMSNFYQVWVVLCAAGLLMVGGSLGKHHPRQYCRRTQACWPTDAQLADFRAEVSGEVMVPGDPGYNMSVKNMMKNTRFTAGPAFIVFVANEADVVDGIEFAKKHVLQISVLSSGHSYVGRSNAAGSLQINLSRLKRVQISTNDVTSPTGASATVQSGSQWKDTYLEVHRYGKVIVGGSAHTVSAGGYTQGGGHSPLSTSLGLAVDNVLSITVITTDGLIRRVTKDGQKILNRNMEVVGRNSDGDLFWALRGGGGGTFGVVTEYKYQIHDPPAGFTRILTAYPFKSPYAGNMGEKVLNFLNGYLASVSHRWGGYIIINNRASDEEKKYGIEGNILLSLLFWGTYEEALPDIQTLFFFNNQEPTQRYYFNVDNYTSFYDYEKTVNDPTGFKVYISNTLLHDEDFNTNVGEFFSEHVDGDTPWGCTVTILGGKMRDYALSSSSVGKGLRDARGSLSCGIMISDEDDVKDVIDRSQVFTRPMRQLGHGVYFNEPDERDDTWKEDFWGWEQYPRLLSLKVKYDRYLWLWCPQCIGSDYKPPGHKETGGASTLVPGLSTSLVLSLVVFGIRA